MNQVNYTENYGNHAFTDLMRSLGEIRDDSTTILDPAMGSGTIRCVNIEKGLQLRIWDCSFTNGLEIFRQPQTVTADRSYTIAYYLTPDSFVLEDCEQSGAVISDVWNILFLSSDAAMKVQILPAKALRCVSLNFSAEWLQKNVLTDIHLKEEMLKSSIENADPFVMFESLSTLERKINESLFDNGTNPCFGKFYWRSKSLNLLMAFFTRMAEKEEVDSDTVRTHEPQLAIVKKQLVESIYIGLPDIKTMARNASVSESKLKRYFRKVYGKNIYNYYQEKRMICAKQLLTEKKMTVAQTACIMGYGSVSSFNNTFKRFFGLKPDAFKNSSMVTVTF